MNKKRLLKLADFLETVPRKQFDLREWRTKEPDAPETGEVGGCGFAGCAMGWAAHEKLFKGLKFCRNGALEYDGERNWYGVGRLFDVPTGEFGDGGLNHLFAYHQYLKPPTPKQVAKRIRQFVKDGGQPK